MFEAMTVASQVKQTLAGLQKSQALLKIYAVQSRCPQAQLAFNEAYHETTEIIRQIEERLKHLELEEPQYRGL
jgi:hypothetical protein